MTAPKEADDADAGALRLAQAMAGYDAAIASLEVNIDDSSAALFLRRRKHDLTRLIRGEQPQLSATLEQEREATLAKRNALHKKLRREDREREIQREKERAHKLEKEKAAEDAKLKRKQLEQLQLGTDRAWKPDDFGLADKFGPEHKKIFVMLSSASS